VRSRLADRLSEEVREYCVETGGVYIGHEPGRAAFADVVEHPRAALAELAGPDAARTDEWSMLPPLPLS
jgi:hypothetical protein